MYFELLYTGNIDVSRSVHTVNGSLTCSFWLQVLDGQTSARPFPVLSDDISLIAVSSLTENGQLLHMVALKKLTMHMLVSSTSFMKSVVHAVYT